jgi:hypothetical protein
VHRGGKDSTRRHQTNETATRQYQLRLGTQGAPKQQSARSYEKSRGIPDLGAPAGTFQ